MHIQSYRWYPPDNVPVKEQGVYLLHGAGEHAGRYEHLVSRLTNAGYCVGAHDHPGHGQSGGKRGVIEPKGALVQQAIAQCNAFCVETGCEPVVFGHSLGGVVATEMLFEHQFAMRGLILSAPAFAPFIRRSDALKVRILALFAPSFTVNRAYSAKALTQDENAQQQAESDPLNHGYKSGSLVSWLITSGRRQLANASALSVDCLLLIAGADRVVDPSKIQEFSDNAPEDKITTRRYETSLHEPLNETSDRSTPVFEDIDRWMEERFPD